MGSMAFLLAVAVGGAPAAWASGTRNVQVKTVHRRTMPYRCQLKVGSGLLRGPGRRPVGRAGDVADDDARSGARPAGPSAGRGNLAVAIPAVVIIRAHGTRFVVTTNTGGPPNQGETFYYLAQGETGVAGPAVGSVVLARCTSHDRR